MGEMNPNHNFCICECFYWRNFHVPGLGHVNYRNKADFVDSYSSILQKNYYSGDKLDSILQEEKFLSPELLSLVQMCNRPDTTQTEVVAKMKTHSADRIYSFPIFTEKFCKEFVEEMVAFETSDLPKGRPNTMNNYGILLNELGFDENFITPLREKYLDPIAKYIYPQWVPDCLDSHKAFVVTYKVDQDVDLSYHFDNAEVTLNVCMGTNFEEGSLYFGSMKTETTPNVEYKECQHKITHGVIHRGQHMHGALPITDGERYNLIIWMRSSSVRNLSCPMCGQKPILIDAPGMGDGFTRKSVQVCQVL